MQKSSTELSQMKEDGLNIPKLKQVSSMAKVNFFLSKLYEGNLISAEDYTIAKKIMSEKRRF